MSNIFFIDIRNPDELMMKRLTDNNYVNLPMNTIRFNLNFIKLLTSAYDKIYIICHSGARSLFIYNKYFKDKEEFKKVHVNKDIQFLKLNDGKNIITTKSNKELIINVKSSNKFNFYNITRIIQFIMGIVLLLIVLLLILDMRLTASLIAIFFGLMTIFNSLTNTCTLSLLLRDLLN